MAEVTLTGGPLDGQTAEIVPGRPTVEVDGCTYAYDAVHGLCVYVGGEPEEKPKPTRRSLRSKIADEEDS